MLILSCFCEDYSGSMDVVSSIVLLFMLFIYQHLQNSLITHACRRNRLSHLLCQGRPGKSSRIPVLLLRVSRPYRLGNCFPLPIHPCATTYLRYLRPSLPFTAFRARTSVREPTGKTPSPTSSSPGPRPITCRPSHPVLGAPPPPPLAAKPGCAKLLVAQVSDVCRLFA